MMALFPDWEEFNQYGWDEEIATLFDDVAGERGWHDDFAELLFNIALVDSESPDVRATAKEMLDVWFRDQYGIEFSQIFDWEAYREWYDNQ